MPASLDANVNDQLGSIGRKAKVAARNLVSHRTNMPASLDANVNDKLGSRGGKAKVAARNLVFQYDC